DQISLCDCGCWDGLVSKYILPYFQRLDHSLQNVSKIVDEWKTLLKKKEEPLQSLGQLSSKILINSKNNETAPYCLTNVSPLCRGEPNLIIQSKKGFAKVSNLYKCLKMIPRSEHVLICKETTTEEEVECLLLRTLLCTKKDNKQNSQIPLYCLVGPEKLAMRTSTKVIKLLQHMLLSQSELRQMHSYLFVMFSSNGENEIAVTLQHFERKSKEVIALLHMEDSLYMKEWRSFLTERSNRKPFVQLYKSEDVGMGKTWKIKHDIEKEEKLERIYVRFNSSTIDWDSTINKFWQHHPCQFNNDSKMDNQEIVTKKKRSKDDLVVYHLDISSCVNKEMNDFLFQLLYLQHIDTDGRSFHVNPNMAFFIEIPSKFDSFSETAADVLYTLFPSSNFPTVDVNKDNNPFQFGKEEQYCIKWIKEFQTGKLRCGEFVDIFVVLNICCIFFLCLQQAYKVEFVKVD
ncbi:hypothetical protein RFI_37474, partial [Reticulomyxa filosa]